MHTLNIDSKKTLEKKSTEKKITVVFYAKSEEENLTMKCGYPSDAISLTGFESIISCFRETHAIDDVTCTWVAYSQSSKGNRPCEAVSYCLP